MLTDTPGTSARLVSEFGYNDGGAALVAAKLANLHGELAEIVERWWRDGATIHFSVRGYTVQSLMADSAMNPIAAILTLDWLLREPDKAERAIRHGHDRIT